MMKLLTNNKAVTFLRYLCFTALLCFADFAWASWSQLGLHGVSQHGAVVQVNGDFFVLKTGQTRHGFTLISVNENGALMSHKGEQKFMALSVVNQLSKSGKIQPSNLISNARPISIQGTRANQANTHIMSVTPVVNESDRLVFRVEYFYNGNSGDMAQLKAYPLTQGKSLGFSSHSYVSLKPGRGYENITLKMNARSPKEFYSDEVLFEILGTKSVNGSYTLLSQAEKIQHKWAKKTLEDKNFIIGNTQWETSTH